MTTLTTALAGWVPCVTLDQGSTIPIGFVVQLCHKLTPANITGRLTEVAILEHALDCQRLDTHHLILADESGRGLVQEITAAISNTGMKTDNSEMCLASVLRAFALLGMSPLRFGRKALSRRRRDCCDLLVNYTQQPDTQQPDTDQLDMQPSFLRYSFLREALRARYSEKWELENPLVNLEFDSFQLSGECVTILHEPMRTPVQTFCV